MTKITKPDQPKYLKVPPNNPELEQVVLGAILLDKDAINIAIDILKPESFYNPKHVDIYAACLTLFNQQQPIDSMTVAQELIRVQKIDSVGGSAYIAQLTLLVGSAANLEYHCRILQQYEVKRSLIHAAMRIEADAYDETIDGLAAMEEAEQAVFSIAQGNNRGAGVNRTKLVINALDSINSILDNPGALTGVPTGFERWDKYSLGMQPGSLILLAARPMMGKTTVACEIALNAAMQGYESVFFSLGDMSALSLAKKMILMIAETPYISIRNRTVKPEDRKKIVRAAETFGELPIKIYDTKALGGTNITSIRSISRNHVASGAKAIICDYIQQIDAPGLRETRAVTDYVGKSIKEMAALLDVPVLALSQLSRSVETRGGSKRPMLSDLRESGTLEQNADDVYFVYRPEYYGIMENEEGESLKGLTEIITAKHRESGDVPQTFMLNRDNDTGRMYSDMRFRAESDPDEFITPNNIIISPSKTSDGRDDIPF